MRLHTGETQTTVTPNWTWEQRQKLGQTYLHDLAEDLLNSAYNNSYFYAGNKHYTERVRSSLELDGYVFSDSRLLAPESDILNTQEESGVLQALYTSLGLADQKTAFHCLKQSEEHWLAGRWDNCISDARRFFEKTLQEVAALHSLQCKGTALPQTQYERPLHVRDYLEREGVLEPREKKTIAEVYGLLSNTGSHPYIAQQDQARLLRQVALIFSQFAMLRLQGILNPGTT